jgi:hypothetical protein
LIGFSTLWLFVSRLQPKSCTLTLTYIPLQLALLNYVIDAYLFVAASALASTTVLRSLAGAVFPVCIFSDRHGVIALTQGIALYVEDVRYSWSSVGGISYRVRCARHDANTVCAQKVREKCTVS